MQTNRRRRHRGQAGDDGAVRAEDLGDAGVDASHAKEDDGSAPPLPSHTYLLQLPLCTRARTHAHDAQIHMNALRTCGCIREHRLNDRTAVAAVACSSRIQLTLLHAVQAKAELDRRAAELRISKHAHRKLNVGDGAAQRRERVGRSKAPLRRAITERQRAVGAPSALLWLSQCGSHRLWAESHPIVDPIKVTHCKSRPAVCSVQCARQRCDLRCRGAQRQHVAVGAGRSARGRVRRGRGSQPWRSRHCA